MDWKVSECGFDAGRMTTNGNKYMIGNGYMGYRGVLEEYGKDQLAAVTLAGVYDRAGDKWREPVNAPNGLYTVISCDGEVLSVLETEPLAHTQSLDLRTAVHRRETMFDIRGGGRVTLTAERFVSMNQLHLLAARWTLHCTVDCRIGIMTGIDGAIWDINGPHLFEQQSSSAGGVLLSTAVTGELGQQVAVAELIAFGTAEQAKRVDAVIELDGGTALRHISIEAKAGETYTWCKYAAVFTGLDGEGDPEEDGPDERAVQTVQEAAATGYGGLLEAHRRKWAERWSRSDCVIEGDDEAQFALRFSMYQLLIIAPTLSEKVSIPARGLSGQVYKGAVFWDTEMFMLPFFSCTVILRLPAI
ncbi:hypothetical protein ACFSQ7_17230 [Paenibacillus rhizoplanae]